MRRFTDAEISRMVRLYESGMTHREISLRIGVPVAVVSRVLHSQGVTTDRHEQPNYLPTEEEIWGRSSTDENAEDLTEDSLTAKIQRGWSERDRRHREVCRLPKCTAQVVESPETILMKRGRD